MKYLKGERLLHHKQYCFLPGRSTTLQLLKVSDEWTEAIDRGKEVVVIYHNFRKAFCSVPHIRLKNILEQYGIRGENLQWIEQLLKSREQRVVVNQEKSLWSYIVSGVPQGSVVGPVLFLLYVNSMPDIVYSKLSLYADRLKLFHEISTFQDQ